jgi:hypothetical protein
MLERLCNIRGRSHASFGAQFAKKVYEPVNAADGFSARPDFLLLLYPVVSMEDKVTHLGSCTNLLGNPSLELNEGQRLYPVMPASGTHAASWLRAMSACKRTGSFSPQIFPRCGQN